MKKKTKKQVIEPKDAVEIARDLIVDNYKEHFIGIYLSSRNVPVKVELVSMGCLNACLIHPREVFRPAIVSHACSVIVLHNHPSGDTEPSEEDLTITKRLKKASEILGIELLDHIIFTKDNKFCSLKDKNLMK